MPNLTRSSGLVRETDSFDPPAGTRLVVYRQTRHGERLHDVLEPGEAFAPSLRGRLGKYRMVAVSCVEDHRHRFSQSYLHKDQVQNFDLHFVLAFRVADVMAFLRHGDPLLKVQEEVERVVGGTVRSLEWEEIEGNRVGVGRRALSSSAPDGDGRWLDLWTRLRDFAYRHGLELSDIEVECRVGELATRIDATAVEASVEQAEIRAKEATVRVRTAETEETLRLKEFQELERELQKQRLRRHIEGIRKAQETEGAILDHVATAVGTVARGVDTPDALGHAARSLVTAGRELQGFRVDAGVGGGRALPAGSSGASLALAEGDGPFRDEGEMLAALLQHVAGLDAAPREQRRILGRVLRLLGEAMQGADADEEQLDRHLADLEGAVDLCDTHEQHEFVSNLFDRRWLGRWG